MCLVGVWWCLAGGGGGRCCDESNRVTPETRDASRDRDLFIAPIKGLSINLTEKA